MLSMSLRIPVAFAVAVLVTVAITFAKCVEEGTTGRATCGHWSAWEIRTSSSSSSIRRRESCSDGRLEEQCRSGEGPVTACSLEDWRPAFAAMPQNNRPHTAKSSLLRASVRYVRSVRYYHYSPYYYTYVSFYCSVGCIVGAVIGGLSALAFLIGGAIVLYCMCARGNRRTVRSGAMASNVTTVIGSSRPLPPPPQQQQFGFTNQSFNGGGGPAGIYDQQQQQPGLYPPAYPASYPPKYPGAYPPPFPPSGGHGFGGASGAVGDSIYPPPYPTAQR